MSLLNIFSKKQDINAGVESCRQDPKAVLLDVRTSEEYRGGHIQDSVNIPLDKIDTIDIDKSRTLYVYCLSGARSGQACAWLRNNGYEAINIGGIRSYNGNLV